MARKRVFHYRNMRGLISYCREADIYIVKVDRIIYGANRIPDVTGATIIELEINFHNAVDQYYDERRERHANIGMARMVKMKNEIEAFKREFAWELMFDHDLQEELSMMYARFFEVAHAYAQR